MTQQPPRPTFTAEDLPGLIQAQVRVEAFHRFVLDRFLVLTGARKLRDIRGVLVEPLTGLAVAEGLWMVPSPGWARYAVEDSGAPTPWIPVVLALPGDSTLPGRPVLREVRIPLDLLFGDAEREARYAEYLTLRAEFEPEAGNPATDATTTAPTGAAAGDRAPWSAAEGSRAPGRPDQEQQQAAQFLFTQAFGDQDGLAFYTAWRHAGYPQQTLRDAHAFVADRLTQGGVPRLVRQRIYLAVDILGLDRAAAHADPVPPSGTPGSPWDNPRANRAPRDKGQARRTVTGIFETIEKTLDATLNPGATPTDDTGAPDLAAAFQDTRRTIEAAGTVFLGTDQTRPILRMLDKAAGALGLPTGCPQCGTMDAPRDLAGTLICPGCGKDRTRKDS